MVIVDVEIPEAYSATSGEVLSMHVGEGTPMRVMLVALSVALSLVLERD